MQENWKRFSLTFYTVFGVALAICIGLILLVDPYRAFPFSLPLERPVMDINQRYFYPMIARSKRFDSLVIGTSTIRLVDPDHLNRLLGGRFANLAMNSATAWEQLQIASLFVRHNGPPRTLIVGIDTVWCDQEADQHRITFRGFPDWLYDENLWNDIPNSLNTRTLEFSIRAIVYWLGLRPSRIRFDGFEVFVPDEKEYDPAKAAQHIWQNMDRNRTPENPAYVMTQEERKALKFPALEDLDLFLGSLAGHTRIILVAVPVHIASQPVAGTKWDAVERECKSRLSDIANRHRAIFSDWRQETDLTKNDENFWDNLHIRLPHAARFTEALAAEAKRN